jgi:hypothetical protein
LQGQPTGTDRQTSLPNPAHCYRIVGHAYKAQIATRQIVSIRIDQNSNVCGAIEVARKPGPGHTIVTVLCDGGGKFQSSLFNREWLLEKGFQVPA